MTTLTAYLADLPADPEELAELRTAILRTGRLRFAAYDAAVAEERAERAAIVKRCGGCQRFLAASSFGVNTARPDGLQTRCKECRRAPQAVAA